MPPAAVWAELTRTRRNFVPIKDARMPIRSLDEIVAVAEQGAISSMGMVVSRIIEVIKRPKSNAIELKALIEMDPALSAIVLRRANSSYYSLKRKLPNRVIMDDAKPETQKMKDEGWFN